MDCDDNGSQCNSLQLAGEDRLKFVSVLRPCVFTKFGFDDSLQGHLKFDSLVETGVFLGIQGQEDNQWIEEFSRGSDQIEFSSDAPESRSATRRNDVWSEATSLESVETLLRSVGHEHTVPEETIIEDSNICGEPGSLINQMEPKCCQDIRSDEHVPSSDSKLPQDDLQEELRGDLAEEPLKVENTSVPQENLASGPDNSRPFAPGGSTDQDDPSVIEENSCVGGELDVKSGSGAEIPVNQSLYHATVEDSSAALVAQMNPCIQNLGSCDASELENDFTPESKDGLSTGIAHDGGDQHVSTREAQTGIEILDCNTGDASGQTLENLVCVASEEAGHINMRKNIDTPAEPVKVLPQRPGLDKNDRGDCRPQVHTDKDDAVMLPTNKGITDSFKNCYSENVPSSDLQQASVLSSIDIAADCASIERKDSGTQLVSSQLSDRENVPESSPREVCLAIDSAPEPSLHGENDHEHSVDKCKSLSNVNAVDSPHTAALSTQIEPENDVMPSEKSGEPAMVDRQAENGERQPSGRGLDLLDQEEETAAKISTDTGLVNIMRSEQAANDLTTASDDIGHCPRDSWPSSSEITGKTSVLPMICNEPDEIGSPAIMAASSSGFFPMELHRSKCSKSIIKEGDAAEAVPPGSDDWSLVMMRCQPSLHGADSKMSGCGSPMIVSSREPCQYHSGTQEAGNSDSSELSAKKVQSPTEDLKVKDGSEDDSSFTFKVNSLPETSGRENGENWSPLTSIAASKSCPVVVGPTPSRLEKTDSVLLHKNPGPSTKVPERELAHETSKSNPELRGGRASVKGSGKERRRKGNHGNETTPDKPSVIVEKISNDSSSSSCSTAHAFQQPFTDMQQVQLRAQIFVYGSIIQGGVPEEACMVSAFGPSDGGRSIWEPLWQAVAKRALNQKAPSVAETHVQPHSGATVPDSACKPDRESKVLPSPVSRVSNMGFSATVASPIIPMSSPLWSMATPSLDGLQSGIVQRVPVLDYQHTVSPAHSYQTPSPRNVVSPTSWPSQASTFVNSYRFSTMPMIETVKLAPVKDSVVSAAPVIKYDVTSSPVVNTVGLTPVFSGTSQLLRSTKAVLLTEQPSADPKPRKRKKVSAVDDLGQISMLPPAQTEPRKRKKVPACDDLGQVSLLVHAQREPIVESSTSSFLVATSVPCLSKVDLSKSVTDASLVDSLVHGKKDDTAAEKTITCADEALTKVVESKLHAEEAAIHAAAAASRCQEVWNELPKQQEAGLTSEAKAQMASTAIAIAAAASVAKAAAAAASVASNAALQAKLMADETLLSIRQGSSSQSDMHIVGKATHTAILKGDNGTNQSNSIPVAAKEAASPNRRVDYASKQAENLDAVVRAAELAGEAVTQAGKIVAMGNPLPLLELIKAGPEGYWRLLKPPNELAVKPSDAGNANEGVHKSPQIPGVSFFPEVDAQMNHDRAPPLSEASSASLDNITRSADDMSGAAGVGEKESRGLENHNPAEMDTSDNVAPLEAKLEMSIVQEEHDTELSASEEANIKEGHRVEVFKDGNGFRAAWFSADVLTIKDERAYVCFVDVISDEGSENIKEWVALYGDGGKAPRIRNVHPHFEASKKRRRSAMGDYVWSIGDKVDLWIRDCWWEGVVKNKKEKDDTTLTVEFPAQGETLTVRAWQLRPSRIWSDGKWMMCSDLREFSSPCKGDAPREKRPRLGSPPVASGVDKLSRDAHPDTGKPEGSRLLPLSSSDKVFNVGKSAREVNKPGAHRTLRTGLQKEKSKVISGVPRPGKTQKVMEVSKQYSEDRSRKKGEASDAVKFAKHVVPQSAASRGWNNPSKTNSKEKQAVDNLKAPSTRGAYTVGRTTSLKANFLKSTVASRGGTDPSHGVDTEDSVGPNDGRSEKQALNGHASSSDAEEADGPLSSLLEGTSKKASLPNPKAPRLTKRKVGASEKLANIGEDKIYSGNGGKSMSEAVEARRYNCRIQPTRKMSVDTEDSVGPSDGLSEKQMLTRHASSSDAEEADGPLSSLLEGTSKKSSLPNPKAPRPTKGKVGASEKLSNIEEDKIYSDNGGKSMSEAVEPRRSNRRIQPTHRLLEGLQSSMLISKIPSASRDKGHKSQRSYSRGK